MANNHEKRNNSQNKKPQGPEKRAVPRIRKVVTIQYSFKDSPDAGIDISQTKDLGEKGVFFTIGNLVSPGTVLKLKLKLPISEESVGLEGEVVSCEEIRKNVVYGIRVKFINLEPGQDELLKKFVQMCLES